MKLGVPFTKSYWPMSELFSQKKKKKKKKKKKNCVNKQINEEKHKKYGCNVFIDDKMFFNKVCVKSFCCFLFAGVNDLTKQFWKLNNYE